LDISVNGAMVQTFDPVEPGIAPRHSRPLIRGHDSVKISAGSSNAPDPGELGVNADNRRTAVMVRRLTQPDPRKP